MRYFLVALRHHRSPPTVMLRSFLLFLVGVTLIWNAPLRASDLGAEDPDVLTLINTKFFGFGAINSAGSVTEGEAALRRIIVKENGVMLLFPVLDRGRLSGKCYALAGIRFLTPDSFEGFCKPLEPWKSVKVKTTVGDNIIEEKLSDVIGMIRTGFYNEYLRAPY